VYLRCATRKPVVVDGKNNSLTQRLGKENVLSFLRMKKKSGGNSIIGDEKKGRNVIDRNVHITI